MCMSASGSQFYIQRLCHKHLDTGPCICCLNRPYYGHNPNWKRILDDILCTDRRSIPANTSRNQPRFVPYIMHLHHKVMDCKGSVVAQVLL